MTLPQPAETMAPLLDAITGSGVPPEQSTALVILPPAQFPTIIAADTDDILGTLAKELGGFKGDVTTEKGRAAIASKARKVAVAKMDLVRLSDKLKADAQKLIKGVNAERNQIEERMDQLRDQVRADLTAYEQRQAARTKGHEDAITDLKLIGIAPPGYSAAELGEWIDKLDALHADREWEEYADKASWTRHASRAALVRQRDDELAREKAEAEAARLAEEAAEAARQEAARLQAEREAEIARQAAETARVAAETAARQEAAMVAAAEAAERARIEREAREAAEAAEAERVRIEAEAREAKEREQQAREDAERRRVVGHEQALASVNRVIEDACSPFNSSAMIQHVSTVLDKMPEMSRDYDWQEYSDQAAAVISAGRNAIAARLNTALFQEEKRRQAIAAEETARAEVALLAQAQREADAAAAALEAERQRVEGERLREEAATRVREEDKAHKGKVNRAARTHIEKIIRRVASSTSDWQIETAQAIVEAIARGEIPGVRISY